MEIDEDSVLSQSEFLTRREVLSRRSRQLNELAEVYKDHYWALMEEVKHQYREYCWEYGKSPFQEDEDRALKRIGGQENNGGDGELGQGLGFGSANRCGVQGCKMKAMALTEFCHLHILRDPKQILYKGCNYVIKSSQAGPILCGKPILRSAVPSLCSPHFHKAEKHVARALKKAGLSANSTSKLAPKFHVIVAEYVNQIQAKRRAAKKETKACDEVKEAENKPLGF